MTTIISFSHNAALAFPVLLQLLAGGTVILAFAAIVVLLLRKNSAAWKHVVWGLATAALLALPALTILLSSLGWRWQLQIPFSVTYSSRMESDTAFDVNRFPRAAEASVARAAGNRSEGIDFADDHLAAISGRDLQATNEQQDPLAPVQITTGLNPCGVLTGVWLMGVVLGIGRFIHRRVSVAGIVHYAVPITDAGLCALENRIRKSAGVSSPVRLMCTPAIAVPVAVGCLRPVILLPAGFGQWSESLCRVVLSHELAHIRRYDVLWQSIARLACLVYWMHPLAWLAYYRMRVEREFACDDAVLEMGEPPRYYATQLLQLASALNRYGRLPEGAVAMAGCGSLEQRVGAILHSGRNRTAVASRTGRMTAAGAFLGVFTLSMISTSTSQMVSAAPEPKTTEQSAPKPAAPATDPLRTPAVGRGFVIVPFLTELQRSYNGSFADAALFLLINATDLCSSDDTTLNMTAVDFNGIEAAMLAYYRQGLDLKGKRIVIHVVEGPNAPKKQPQPTGASSILSLYLRQRSWTNPPNEVQFTNRNAKRPLDWIRLVAELSNVPTDEDIRREAGVGNELVKVYPVRTSLSRYFLGKPENVVLRNLKPCDQFTPEEVETFAGLVKNQLSKLELGEPPVINFVEDFGHSSSKANKVAPKLTAGLEKNGVDIWGHTLWSDGKQHTTPFFCSSRLLTPMDALLKTQTSQRLSRPSSRRQCGSNVKRMAAGARMA